MLSVRLYETCFAIAFLLSFYILFTATWRLFLSPLAHFPGPKKAALTLWYECYYDMFTPGGGMYIWKIQDMHERYGKQIT